MHMTQQDCPTSSRPPLPNIRQARTVVQGSTMHFASAVESVQEAELEGVEAAWPERHTRPRRCAERG